MRSFDQAIAICEKLNSLKKIAPSLKWQIGNQKTITDQLPKKHENITYIEADHKEIESIVSQKQERLRRR